MGGDFLDFFTLTDGAIGIYLGDVSGKGLPAELYAALAVGTLRGVHKTGAPPSSGLSLLNRRVMLRGVTPRYAAVQYACLDPCTGILRIASAGMAGPVLLSTQEIASWIFAASHPECSQKPNTRARRCNWNAATR